MHKHIYIYTYIYIYVCIYLHIYLDKREGAPLPERVARVDEFVGAALESARVCHLALSEPRDQRRKTEAPRFAQENQRRQPCKGLRDIDR